jgi:flavin-dependent dehydrogenase
MRAFGTRQARVAQVSLKPAAPHDQCIMEGTTNGWAFLLPFAPGHASLQFVSALSPDRTPASQHVISGTRAIREAVADAGAWSAPMPCMPRLGNMLAAPGRLAVGEAALGFDPISGDGVGHALRGTVLAAKTLGEITGGADPSECLDRYAATLRRALLQHVDICLSLYGDAPDACCWSGELEAMRSGAAHLRQSAAATQREFDRTI